MPINYAPPLSCDLLAGVQVPPDGLLRRLLRRLLGDDRPEELVLESPRPGPTGSRHEQGIPHQGNSGRGRAGILP